MEGAEPIGLEDLAAASAGELPSVDAVPSRIRADQFALAAIVTGALCIAFAPIFVRLSELQPTATAFQRMLLALPLFVLWDGLDASRRRRVDGTSRVRLDARQRWMLVLAGLFFAADLAVWHWSIAYTSVANSTLLANMAPLVVTVVAWLFFHERISRGFVAGLVLALAGAVLLVQAGSGSGAHHLLGDALALSTAFFYAGYLLTVKDLRRTVGTARLMVVSSAVSAACLLAVSLVQGESLWPSTARGWLVVLGLAWLAQVVGQGLIAFGMARLPASFSSVSLLLQPPAAAVLAWLLLGESLSGWQLAGGAAVLAGIVWARRASRT